MGLTTNQIIIIVCAVVVVGVIIAAIVLSRPKDQTDPNYTTKPTTKAITNPITNYTTKSITNPINKSTSTPIVNIQPVILITTLTREVPVPVTAECWSSVLKDEYCIKITLPSNIKATTFRWPTGSFLEKVKTLVAAAMGNKLVRCDNNLLSLITKEEITKRVWPSKIVPDNTPVDILLNEGILDEEIPAGTTRSFSIEDKVIGFKFTKV